VQKSDVSKKKQSAMHQVMSSLRNGFVVILLQFTGNTMAHARDTQ